uniref:Proline-rich protein n=1 Tax=Leersia perrieri TaxID=77586 RepID=A0A0D9VRU5_9ORYZ
MGARLVPPGTAALLGALVALLAVSFGTAAPAPVLVGSIKCLDCSPDDVKAEDAFRGLQVGIMCNSGAGEAYETKALSSLDENGGFSIPLAADLLRDDGELGKDCFAQLHTAPDTPCTGQTPPRIAKAAAPDNGTISADAAADANANAAPTYLAVSDDTVFSPVACKCGKYKKKHFMFAPPPPPPRPPAPEYKPPTPTPTPTPEPSYGPPPAPKPPVEDEPEPFFKKHPKMKFMHKKKPCPPLVDEDIPRPNN